MNASLFRPLPLSAQPSPFRPPAIPLPYLPRVTLPRPRLLLRLRALARIAAGQQPTRRHYGRTPISALVLPDTAAQLGR